MSWQPNGQSTCENYIAHDNRFYIVWKITWTEHVVNPRYIKQLPFSWWSALFSSTFIWTKTFFKVNLSRCMHLLRSHCRFIFTNSIFIRIRRRLAKKKTQEFERIVQALDKLEPWATDLVCQTYCMTPPQNRPAKGNFWIQFGVEKIWILAMTPARAELCFLWWWIFQLF